MAKGGKRVGSGRPAGSPNKITLSVREAIAEFAQANVIHMSEWLNDIDDPAKRLDLYLRALEYHVPKLGRTEHTGKDGEDIRVVSIAPTDARL